MDVRYLVLLVVSSRVRPIRRFPQNVAQLPFSTNQSGGRFWRQTRLTAQLSRSDTRDNPTSSEKDSHLSQQDLSIKDLDTSSLMVATYTVFGRQVGAHVLSMTTLGTTFALIYLATPAKTKQKETGPPINAASKDEEKFIQDFLKNANGGDPKATAKS
ncbi:MAG: hypothetical protein Q9201_006612 [Fulgogasparrea decipioides]